MGPDEHVSLTISYCSYAGGLDKMKIAKKQCCVVASWVGEGPDADPRLVRTGSLRRPDAAFENSFNDLKFLIILLTG